MQLVYLKSITLRCEVITTNRKNHKKTGKELTIKRIKEKAVPLVDGGQLSVPGGGDHGIARKHTS